MKTKKVILFSIANLVALFIIWVIAENATQKKKFGSKFKPNSFIMTDTVNCNASASEAYQFYIHHYDEIYHKTAKKHHEFKLLNSDSIAKGTRIYCCEGEETNMVHHQYVVQDVIPNKLIFKASEPSEVHIKTDKGLTIQKCNSYVYVEFIDISENESRVAFTIAVQMPNYFYKLIGRITGGKEAKKEWEGHLNEELIGFVENYNSFIHK
jgi:hypothetical protein